VKCNGVKRLTTATVARVQHSAERGIPAVPFQSRPPRKESSRCPRCPSHPGPLDPLRFNAPTLPRPRGSTPRGAFLRLRTAILEGYSYRQLRGVDWKERFGRFGPKLRSSRTAEEFAREAARLLSAAEDIHLWLRVKGRTVPTYRRCARRNVDLLLLSKLVPGWRQHSDIVMSGEFPDGILYLCLRAWPAEAPQRLRPAYRVLRHAAAAGRPLIIDVRANGGGAEPLAARFAGCFIRRSVCYAKHLSMRAGILRGPFKRRLRPNLAAPQYRGRVALLVGPGTVSSCESFVMMMKQVDGCKIIGQRTAGASGNPKPVDLGNGAVAFIPSWQDLDLRGVCLEGRGVAPDIEVKADRRVQAVFPRPNGEPKAIPCSKGGAFRSQDPALAAALRFLRR